MRTHDITGIIFETFSVESKQQGKLQTGKVSAVLLLRLCCHRHIELLFSKVDLIENGRDVPVTEENKDHFFKLVIAWRTEFCVSGPLKAFLEGVSMIVPLPLLQVFSLTELVCGAQRIFVGPDKTHLVCSCCAPSCAGVARQWANRCACRRFASVHNIHRGVPRELKGCPMVRAVSMRAHICDTLFRRLWQYLRESTNEERGSFLQVRCCELTA